MDEYQKYRKARMEFNYLRKYIRKCRAWADNRKNYELMMKSGWGFIVDSEVNQSKARMNELHLFMLSLDSGDKFRVRFEKEMKNV